ncbi:MAG: hypothetical protein WDZ65_06720 [Aquisalimonadaceae bacterium]
MQQKARWQQRVEELCAATGRALAGEPRLHYRAGRLLRGDKPVPVHAPHLRLDPEQHDFAAYRGMIDSVALRLRHSDADLHKSLAPADPIARLVFELLEQFRVEAMAPATMPGMVANLRRRYEQWLRDFHGAGMTETDVGVLLFTVVQIFRARLTGEPALEETEGVIEATRAAIAPRLGEGVAGLRRSRHDQRAFAGHALALARMISGMIGQAGAGVEVGQDEDDEDNAALAAFALLLDFEIEDEARIQGRDRGATGGRSREEVDGGYSVFTRQYDRELAAATLVRPELLAEYRRQLDANVAAQGINRRRLIRQLTALLAVPRRDGWSFGEEAGHIDGRRLSQLVSAPTERRLFRLERETPVGDAVIGILIDCSGSMKEHIEAVAALVDILVRALEQAGAKTEVLGFTTGGWNGGRAWMDWLGRGRPKNPGRVNELNHIVFKPAERSWRRARRDIAALLKQDLFREGIDGEAVEWACGRLLARAERRRTLIVISDGCPMDRATALANGEHYLDGHLREVVARYEARQEMEIVGLGVGFDMSGYYARSLATDLTRGLDNQLFFDIVQLMGGRHQR